MKIKISRKSLNELLDILIAILHSDGSQKLKLDNFLIRLSVLPFYTGEKREKRVVELKNFIKTLDDESISKFYEFNKNYLTWLETYYPKYVEKFKIVEEFETENSDFDGDDFFDFDSEEIDESINEMHYEDKDKMSASEFMEQYGIDEDLILDLELYLKEFHNVVLFNLQLDEEYLKAVQKILAKFIYLLEISVDFKDLAEGLRKLEYMIKSLDFNNFDKNKKKLFRLLIETVFSDIEKWMDEVIINQTAQDIHYLDASLLANISQIEISVNGGGVVEMNHSITSVNNIEVFYTKERLNAHL